MKIEKIYCQTPHPNEDPKDQFGFGVTLKSKGLYMQRQLNQMPGVKDEFEHVFLKVSILKFGTIESEINSVKH